MAIDYTPPLPLRNRLLAALPAADYARLQPQLESVSLGYQEVIHAPHQPIVHVYFPQDGVVSLVMVMADGTTADVAMMGNDGMVGLTVFFGPETTPTQALSHIAGDALRMPADRFRAEAQQHGPLQDVLRCYTQSFVTQIAQVAACHRLHTLTAQYARWLLMTYDRVGSRPFPLTQAFLAQLQGVRRARINETGRRFRRAGLIHYTRGTLAIRDRPGLEAIACECYGIISREYTRLLG
jgi:CRP-like cAMP-binding protein